MSFKPKQPVCTSSDSRVHMIQSMDSGIATLFHAGDEETVTAAVDDLRIPTWDELADSLSQFEKEGACPMCGESNIDVGKIKVEAATANQEINCNACQIGWVDHYELVRRYPGT